MDDELGDPVLTYVPEDSKSRQLSIGRPRKPSIFDCIIKTICPSA